MRSIQRMTFHDGEFYLEGVCIGDYIEAVFIQPFGAIVGDDGHTYRCFTMRLTCSANLKPMVVEFLAATSKVWHQFYRFTAGTPICMRDKGGLQVTAIPMSRGAA